MPWVQETEEPAGWGAGSVASFRGNLGHSFFPILGARGPRYKMSGGITRQGDRRLEDAVKGPRGGGDGGQRSVRRTALRAR